MEWDEAKTAGSGISVIEREKELQFFFSRDPAGCEDTGRRLCRLVGREMVKEQG